MAQTRWRPARLLAAFILAHPPLLLVVVLEPNSWPWVLAVYIVFHATIILVGLWPRSTGLGSNWTRLPAAAATRRQVAITIDDGPDAAVTPAVLDILATHQAKATFFCVGRRARAHPELIAQLIEQGHAVENHTEHHRPSFAFFGFGGMKREIAAAQLSLTELCGREPRFFRAPAGLRNPFLDPALAELGLQLASWTRRGFDTRERDAERVLRRLLRGLTAGDILLLHDGHAAIDKRSGRPVILEVLPELLARCRNEGLQPVTLAEVLGQ
jgi:peptidoglycan/xylan/chitin deacetylase (PgdA/CDA1 family)